MSGVKRQSGRAAASDQLATVRAPRAPSRRVNENVALLIQRQGSNPSERLVVEIGYANVEIEHIEVALDFHGSQRRHDDAGAVIALGEGRGQQWNDRQRDGYCPDLEPTDHSLSHLAQLLLEAAIVDKHALRPGEHALTFLGEANEPVSTLDNQNAQNSPRVA